MKVLWCHSHLVWLVFEASIPTWTCFPSENFLCLVSVAFFVLSLRNGRREERWEGRPRGRCMVNIKLTIVINSNASK